MSKVITREVYSAVEVDVNEFSDGDLTEELEDRGHLVINNATLHDWYRLKMSNQVDMVHKEVCHVIDMVLRDL
jgi:hypothetical protein